MSTSNYVSDKFAREYAERLAEKANEPMRISSSPPQLHEPFGELRSQIEMQTRRLYDSVKLLHNMGDDRYWLQASDPNGSAVVSVTTGGCATLGDPGCE